MGALQLYLLLILAVRQSSKKGFEFLGSNVNMVGRPAPTVSLEVVGSQDRAADALCLTWLDARCSMPKMTGNTLSGNAWCSIGKQSTLDI